MLSSRARYATRALLDLSERFEEGPVLVQEIAERQKIPAKYLQKILVDLKAAGFVQSRKGPGGGYSLAREPQSITLGQVVAAMDGRVVDLTCVVSGSHIECECPYPDTCVLRSAFDRLAESMTKVLDSMTFAELCAEQSTANAAAQRIVDFVI